MSISCKDHVAKEDVRREMNAAVGKYEKLLTLNKKRKLCWFEYITRPSGLTKTVLQDTVKGKEGKVDRRRFAKTVIIE